MIVKWEIMRENFVDESFHCLNSRNQNFVICKDYDKFLWSEYDDQDN